MRNSESENQWIERLAKEARILGEARMLRDEQQITPEIVQTIITRFDALIARLGKSNGWAARSMGISESMLSLVLSGSYAGDSEKQIRLIDKWIEQQILRETAPKPAGFVKTVIAERIYATARWVSEINAIGVVHGPAGIGKTITLQALRAEMSGSLYVRINTAGESKLAVLETIAAACRMGGMMITTSRLFRALSEPHGPLRDTNRLILVDEVHKLVGRSKDQALHCLRDLHDETGCPMLLAGMSNFADYVQCGKSRFEPLDQLNSRIKYWLNLREVAEGSDGGPGLFSVEDILKWINSQKIRITEDAVRYLQMLANTVGMGGLRTCDGLIRIALKFQARMGDDKPISADMLRQIRGEQFGERTADAFERQIEQKAARTA